MNGTCKSCGAGGMPLTNGGYCGYCAGEATLIPEEPGNIHSSDYDAYASYDHGDNRVTLDGIFDAQELRAIADHMDKHGK